MRVGKVRRSSVDDCLPSVLNTTGREAGEVILSAGGVCVLSSGNGAESMADILAQTSGGVACWMLLMEGTECRDDPDCWMCRVRTGAVGSA